MALKSLFTKIKASFIGLILIASIQAINCKGNVTPAVCQRSMFTDTTDMDPTASWYYSGLYSPDFQTVGDGICISVLGHETIDGRYCHIIGRIEYDLIFPESFIPIYEKYRKVYFYEDNEWRLLYDYNASVGDTVTYYISKKSNEYYIGGSIDIEPMAYLDNPYRLVVEKIDTVSNNVGGQIRRFTVKRLGEQLFHNFSYIFEGIGFDWGLFGMNDVTFITDGTFPVGLSCYSEQEINYLHPVYPRCKPTSVDDLNKNSFKIYPNPAFEILSIEKNTTFNDITSVDILNINGTVIKSEMLQNHDLFNIDISNLPRGVYFVRVKNDNYFSETKKFVKM